MSCSIFLAVVVAGLAIFATHVLHQESFDCIVANMYLFTPYRNETKAAYRKCFQHNLHVKFDHSHVPIVKSEDYSFEALRHATNNFRSPAIVRGHFLGSPAYEKWVTPDYWSSKIGDFIIPTVGNGTYGTSHDNKLYLKFRDMAAEIYGNPDSKLYAFFPVKSKLFHVKDMEEYLKLEAIINEVVNEDLELEKRLWPGFGTKAHKTFVGSQLIFGQGKNDSIQTTGSGWHCAGGNNWFVQVYGTKRWYFLHPRDSKYMWPVRNGRNTFATSNPMSGALHDHMPLMYADIQPGDLLYNPDFYWHTIKNYAGFSFAVPIREANYSLLYRSNTHFTGVIAVNNLYFKLTGQELGGYVNN